MQRTYTSPTHYLENVIRDRRYRIFDDSRTALKAAWIIKQILDVKNVHICEVRVSMRGSGINDEGEPRLYIGLNITGGDINGLVKLATEIKGFDFYWSQFQVPFGKGWIDTSGKFKPEDGLKPTDDQIDERVRWLYTLIHQPIQRCINCDGVMAFTPYKETDDEFNTDKVGKAMCRSNGCDRQYDYFVIYEDGSITPDRNF